MRKPIIGLLLLFFLAVPTVYGDNVDPLLEYSKGNVEGHSVLEKFGHNEAVGGALTTIWSNGTLYPWLETATLLNISSTDVDDVLFDTGAWNVTIIGLDANYVEQNETVVLNGQTPVPTTLQFLRVFRMYVRKSGITETNEGIIRAGTGPTVAGNPLNEYARIAQNYGQSQMAVYTVPANCTAFIRYVDITTWASVVKRFEVYLIQRPFNESFRRMSEWNFDRSTHFVDKPYLRFESRTDIEFRGEVSTGTGFVSVIFDMVLVDNSSFNIADQAAASNNTLLYLILSVAILLGLGGVFIGKK